MTLYAQVTNGQIVRDAPAPTAPGYGPDGQWHDYTDPAELAAYLADGGWLPVVETPRPADTATHTHRAVYTLTGDTVTQAWETVPKSAEAIAAETDTANEATLKAQVAEQVGALAVALDTIKATRGAKKGIIGSGTDPAGTTTLQAWRNQAAANVVTAASVKALAKLVIDSIQADRDTDKALIGAQRALIRLSRLTARVLDSADSGTPDATT